MGILKFRLVVPLLYFILLVTFVSAQTTAPTSMPLFEFKLPFPTHLHCPDISSPYLGPRWKNFQIGVSTITELDTYLNNLNPNYNRSRIDSVNFVSYTLSLSIRKAEDLGIPSLVNVCFDPQSRIITAISPGNLVDSPFLSDLLIRYGEPDAVTWDLSTETRLVFWFEDGVAATIRVDLTERFAPYGTVLSMTYFPFQPIEGYENRWPYNRTVSGEQLEDLQRRATLTPSVPNEENPFDFEAMIATITAEPSRTPSPTLTTTTAP